MATITPNVTDNVTIIAAATLARGSTTRGTIDLRTAFGAWIFPKIGRGGTTAISGGTLVGIKFHARRVINNDTATAGGVHAVGTPALLSSTTATTMGSSTVSSDSNSGQAVLTVASGTNFASEDLICIQDSGGGVTRLEWHRISKVSGGTLTLDRNLQFTHTAAQADTVRNKSDVFAPVWLPGLSLWECIFDYGDATGGDTATVICLGQTYLSETAA